MGFAVLFTVAFPYWSSSCSDPARTLPLEADSPIARFLGDAPTKLHHTAYRVDDVAAKLAELKAKGVRFIDERPRKGAHGNLIAFLHPKSTGGVLIELCQRG